MVPDCLDAMSQSRHAVPCSVRLTNLTNQFNTRPLGTVVGLAPERLMLQRRVLPAAVINAIQSACGPYTSSLYAAKWGAFSKWCGSNGVTPLVSCNIGERLGLASHRVAWVTVSQAHFELLCLTHLDALSFKTAFLLALVSAKHAADHSVCQHKLPVA